MAIVAGCVPFMNARPLVAWFESLGDGSPVRVIYDVPSQLPALLDSGAAEAILVSSLDALTTPGRSVAGGVCIGTRGRAESVRLFSKVPFEKIGTLALDESSMTSNALAQVVLIESFGASPECEPCAPDLDEMLNEHDAALLIGDIGLMTPSRDLHVLDLGHAWTKLSGKPFVWALWTGNQISPELAAYFSEALRWAESRMDEIVEHAAKNGGCDLETCRKYLAETMNYRLEQEDLAGFRAFGELVTQHGIANAMRDPKVVEPLTPAAVSE